MKNLLKGKAKYFVIALAFVIAVSIIAIINNATTKSKTENSTQIAENAIQVAEELKDETVVQSGTVTVYYLDDKGNELLEPTVKSGNVGDWYSVERIEISKYTIAEEDPITKAGYYELGNIDVKFIYKYAGEEVGIKVRNEGVEVEGEETPSESYVNVMFNNTKTKTDYGVKIITKDTAGNIINGAEFEFLKDENMLRKGQVRNGVFYVGKIGVKQDGNIPYEIVQTKATVGYAKIEGKIGLNLTSIWNEETKKYELTNAKTTTEGTSAYINEKNEIVVEVINRKYKDMYEMEVIHKTETEVLSGAKIKVEKQSNTVVEDYVENGKLTVGTFEITEPGADVYEIYEVESIEGYNQVATKENPAKVKVEKTFNNETKKYEVKASSNKIEGLAVQVEGNKVIIYLQTKKKVDKYDLSVKKFISEIDGEEVENREPVVSINNEGKFEYTQTKEIEQAANEQKVTYRLRMYNESENAGKGKRIIEYIPAGLVFLPEDEINKKYGWKAYVEDKDGDLVEADNVEEATVVVSDYLVDMEIEGYNKEAVEEYLNSKDADENNNESNATTEDKESNQDDVKTTNYLNYIDAEVIFEVDEDKITSEDRIIENKIAIEPNENDDNPENDESTEKIYIKYFDLSVKKYIKEVKVKNNIKETVQEVGEAKKDQLIKIDVAKSEVNNTTITVTYGLKVTNVGEIEGYATELIDYIPQDFKLVEDGIWKVKGNQAVTTKLENKLLKPGQSATLEITFEWKLTENNIGSRINEGKITKYENPYNAIDRTGENNDKEELVVAVRTGEFLYYFIPGIIVLGMIAIVVYIIAEYKARKDDESQINEEEN